MHVYMFVCLLVGAYKIKAKCGLWGKVMFRLFPRLNLRDNGK